MDLQKYFPYDVMRPQQEQVLTELYSHWADKKYFFLQLDVGTGKSGIAKAAANWSESAAVITGTKQLQDQYIADFKHEGDIASIKGKGNYECIKNHLLTCENGPCTLKKDGHKPSCIGDCLYTKAIEQARMAHTMITSYAYLFTIGSPNKSFKSRDLMVFDECHMMEDQLLSHASFVIDPKKLQDTYGIFKDFTLKEINEKIKAFTESGWDANKNRFDSLLKDVNTAISIMQDDIDDLASTESLEDSYVVDLYNQKNKAIHKLMSLSGKMYGLCNADKADWLIVPNADGNLECTPLKINGLFSKFCSAWANKFIFMSATIFDVDGYIADLGINPEECYIIKLNSAFDPAKSPIYYMPCGSMNYKDLDGSLPKVTNTVRSILNHHAADKGIIHTGNYKVAKYLNAALTDRRILMKESNTISNSDLLRIHSKSKNTVLMSPSMTTGVDLKDDLSRFQVIVKMPFSSLGDLRTKTKADQNSTWYAIKMLRELVQASGRSTRSEDDFSATYILDSSFKYWVFKYKKYLPDYFLNRIKGF